LSARTTRFAEILSYIARAGCTFIAISAMLIGIIAIQTSMYPMYYFVKSDLILFVFLLIIMSSAKDVIIDYIILAENKKFRIF
jgi:hypothetical protein